MKNIIWIFLICAACAACGKPRPMTFEEQQIYMAKQQCSQAATDMNPEWPNSGNPNWDAYFTMCMNQFGISDKELRLMWY